MEKNNIDFIGIGNAIVDVQAQVEDKDLKKFNLNKGIMSLVDYNQFLEIEKVFHEKDIKMSGGGSVANTTFALQKLGSSCAFVGQVGNDPQGSFYIKEFQDIGVLNLVEPISGRSGVSFVLITPDAQRTMNTYLGASIELNKTDHPIPNSRYLMVEGYLFDCPKAMNLIISMVSQAKKRGTKIILSCSDPFCVDRYKNLFIEFIESYCDIVIANELEAQHLLSTQDFKSVESKIHQLCDLFVITKSESGSELFTSKGEYLFSPAICVDAIDTTGAGDYFAAGFIWSLLQKNSYAQCLNYGNRAASQVIVKFGARIQELRLQ